MCKNFANDDCMTNLDRVYARIMDSEKQGNWRYFITVCCCFAALGIRLAITSEDSGLQFVTFFPTVAMTALFYGTSSGLLSTIICSILSAYFLFEPYQSFVFAFDHKTILSLFVFGADGVIVSVSLGMMHRYFSKYHQNLHELEVALRRSQENEEIISQLAFYDPLTKLANRRLLSERLEYSFLESERSQEYGALIFLDLDKFKPLNDLYGHESGDKLLIEVAERLKYSVRQIDTVARFGGDEFVVLLNELGKTEIEAKQMSLTIAEKIRCSLAKPYRLNINNTILEHECTSSIGIINFIGITKDQAEIFRQADNAMYCAKNNGRNSICQF